MAEKRTRRSFTREFKAQAVKRLLDGGRGVIGDGDRARAEHGAAEHVAQ
jgi:transposase-like protein